MAARESSLLFSLQGLMQTEQERIEQEAKAAQRRREEDHRRTAEVAQRRLQAAERERAAKERQAALEREHEQLEQARLEAMKRGAVERARIEAEAQARLVEAEKQREHALRLAKIREDERALRLRTFAWLSSAAFVLLLGGASFGYFGQVLPQREQLASSYEQQLHAERERARAASGALAAERLRSEGLLAQLQALSRAQAAAGAASEPSATAKPDKLRPAPATQSGAPRPPGKRTCKDDGDPLNGSLCR